MHLVLHVHSQLEGFQLTSRGIANAQLYNLLMCTLICTVLSVNVCKLITVLYPIFIIFKLHFFCSHGIHILIQ